MPAQLVMRRGPKVGQTFPVSGELVMIGRGMRNHVIIDDNEVSRDHCRLTKLENNYELCDLNSRNGTFGSNNALGVQMFAAARRTFLGLPTPNPGANSTSRVDVALAQPSHVWLDVVDQEGNSRGEVLGNVVLRAGVHRVEYSGEHLPSGQYFVRLRTDHGEAFTQKLILNR